MIHLSVILQRQIGAVSVAKEKKMGTDLILQEQLVGGVKSEVINREIKGGY